MSQKRDIKGLTTFLQKIYEESTKKNCNISLISGEDFENFLVDTHLAIEFEVIAKSIGFYDIEWFVVQRNPIDYLLSIYAEKSAYKMVLDLGLMANSVLEYGFFSASSAKYNYKFVFDVSRFSNFFKKNVNANLMVIEFDKFIDVFPGYIIFNQLTNKDYLLSLKADAKSIGIQRQRLPDEKIEFRYVANFLSMKSNKEFYEANKNLVDSLINHRLNRNKDLLPEIQIKFKERFG